MKQIIAILTSLSFLLLLWGCPGSKFKHSEGEFPENATNLVGVNTVYDDYNSALPEIHIGHNLIFSSNRKTQGGTFDIVGENMHITWFMENGILQIDNTAGFIENDFLKPLLDQLNTAANEFGPFILGYDDRQQSEVYRRLNFITYSTEDSSGKFRSRMVYNEKFFTNDSIVSQERVL